MAVLVEVETVLTLAIIVAIETGILLAIAIIRFVAWKTREPYPVIDQALRCRECRRVWMETIERRSRTGCKATYVFQCPSCSKLNKFVVSDDRTTCDPRQTADVERYDG